MEALKFLGYIFLALVVVGFFGFVIAILRVLHWIVRALVATGIILAALYYAVEKSGGAVDWGAILVEKSGGAVALGVILIGFLVYSLLLVSELSSDDVVTVSDLAEVHEEVTRLKEREDSRRAVEEEVTELSQRMSDFWELDNFHKELLREDIAKQMKECEALRAEAASLRADLERLQAQNTSEELWGLKEEVSSLRRELDILRAKR